MSWQIEYTDNFENWWQTLTEEQINAFMKNIFRLRMNYMTSTSKKLQRKA